MIEKQQEVQEPLKIEFLQGSKPKYLRQYGSIRRKYFGEADTVKNDFQRLPRINPDDIHNNPLPPWHSFSL